MKSVANVTARDIADTLQLGAQMGIRPEVEEYGLAEANRALMELKAGSLRGAKVLRMA
jgi:propanol-preferring alcohol dehydrogenase